MSARDERAVLGSLITGALTLRDVADVGEWFASEFHASILCVLVAALECRAAGQRIPGGRGIDLAWACRACELGGAWPIRERRVDGRLVGYLPDLAREKTGRTRALEAIAALKAEALHRWDIERDRDRLARALDERAAAFLAHVQETGTFMSPSGVEYMIEPEALQQIACEAT